MMFDDSPGRLPVVRVKREGGRGWRWINAAEFDPQRHELHDDAPTDEVAQDSASDVAAEQDADAPRKRGRAQN